MGKENPTQEHPVLDMKIQALLSEVIVRARLREDTASAVQEKMMKGAIEYGDWSYTLGVLGICEEMVCESHDFIGWGNFLFRLCKTEGQRQELCELFKMQEIIIDRLRALAGEIGWVEDDDE